MPIPETQFFFFGGGMGIQPDPLENKRPLSHHSLPLLALCKYQENWFSHTSLRGIIFLGITYIIDHRFLKNIARLPFHPNEQKLKNINLLNTHSQARYIDNNPIAVFH